MSFDALAPWYRLMETITAGRILQRARTAFLEEVSGCRRALLLGEGPGKFLVALLQSNPAVNVVVVEQSARMIQEARRALVHSGLGEARVTFLQENALNWEPDGTFDLLVTHCFFDCFQPDEIHLLVSKLSACSQPDTLWLLADFQAPASGWRRWRAILVLGVLYRFFRWVTNLSATTLTPPSPFLEAAGFSLQQRQEYNFSLIHSDIWKRQSELPSHSVVIKHTPTEIVLVNTDWSLHSPAP